MPVKKLTKDSIRPKKVRAIRFMIRAKVRLAPVNRKIDEARDIDSEPRIFKWPDRDKIKLMKIRIIAKKGHASLSSRLVNMVLAIVKRR